MAKSHTGKEALTFDLELPCEVIRIGNRSLNVGCRTTAVGSSQVSLSNLRVQMAVGERIDYIVHHLPKAQATNQLRCVGRALRIDPNGATVTLERHTFQRVIGAPRAD